MNSEKHTLLVKRNKTLAQLKLMISKEYEMSFLSVGMNVPNNPELDFSHNQNSKSLESLNVK
jgi:hypothetical protein